MSEIILHETCGTCPEQYEARIDEEIVGYLRLRHGVFIVECPDVKGEEVFHAYPRGDGAFRDNEREYYLKRAIVAIQEWHGMSLKLKKKL